MSDASVAPRGAFLRIAFHELRVLVADRTLPAILVLLSVLIVYAVLTGVTETRERDGVVQGLLERQVERDRAAVDLWHDVMSGRVTPDPFANPVDPAAVGSSMGARYAVLPTTPLAPIAFGQSDMLPDYYQVSYRSRVNFMYDSEVENPWNLLSGRFDLAFVVVYLLPLLVFALSFNMLSAEREQGTLRLLLSQPISLRKLVAAKVAVRSLVLLGAAVLIPALLLVFLRPQAFSGDGLFDLGLMLILIAAYGLFWFALAVLVNAFALSSAANALILAGTWVTFILIIPVALNLIVSIASPAPSRTELATQTRLVTIEGLNEYNALFSADYRYTDDASALLPKDGRLEVAPRLQGFYMIAAKVDDRIQPMLETFERQLAGQQRLVDRYGVVSPAIIAQEGLSLLAGNGSRRYLSFQDQVIAHHERWKTYFVPKVMNGVAITEQDFADMPKWSWEELPRNATVSDALIRIAQILLAVILMGLLAALRLRRFRIA